MALFFFQLVNHVNLTILIILKEIKMTPYEKQYLDLSKKFEINKGQILLGTWQGIYIFEHREKIHNRKIKLHLIG